MKEPMDIPVLPQPRPARSWRRRRPLALMGAIVLAMTSLVVALSSTRSSGTTTVRSASESVAEAGGEGFLSEKIGIHSERDASGVVWKAVTYESPDGRCIDVEASSGSGGSPLGRVGGCGLGDIVFDAAGFRAVDGRTVLLPATGLLSVRASQPAVSTLVYGVASCACTVRVALSDGTILTRRPISGFFFTRVPHATGVERVEAVDEAGRTVGQYLMGNTIPDHTP